MVRYRSISRMQGLRVETALTGYTTTCSWVQMTTGCSYFPEIIFWLWLYLYRCFCRQFRVQGLQVPPLQIQCTPHHTVAERGRRFVWKSVFRSWENEWNLQVNYSHVRMKLATQSLIPSIGFLHWTHLFICYIHIQAT